MMTEINSYQNQECHSSLQQCSPELKGIGDGLAVGDLRHNGVSNFGGNLYQNSCDPQKSSDCLDIVFKPSDEQQPGGNTEVGFTNICDTPILTDESEKSTSIQASPVVTGHSCVKGVDTCVCFNREGSRFSSPGKSNAYCSSLGLNLSQGDTGQDPLCHIEPVSMRSSEKINEGKLVLSEEQGQSVQHHSNHLPQHNSQRTANNSDSPFSHSFLTDNESNQYSGMESGRKVANLVEQSECGKSEAIGPLSSQAVEEHRKILDPVGASSDMKRDRTSDYFIVDERNITPSHKECPHLAREENHANERKSTDHTITQGAHTSCLGQVVSESAAESSPVFDNLYIKGTGPSTGTVNLLMKNDEGVVENASIENFASEGEYFGETSTRDGLVKCTNESKLSKRGVVIEQAGEIEQTEGSMNLEHSRDHTGKLSSQVESETETGNSPYIAQNEAENESHFSQCRMEEMEKRPPAEMEVKMEQPLKKDEKGNVQFEEGKGSGQPSNQHDERTDEKCEEFSRTLRTNIVLRHETHMCTMVKFADGTCKYIKDEPVSDVEDSFYCSNTGRNGEEMDTDTGMGYTHILKHPKVEAPSSESEVGSQSFGGCALQQSPERTDSELSQTGADKARTLCTTETDSSGSSLIPGSTEREAATDGQSSCDYDSEGWQLGSDDGQEKSTTSALQRDDESDDGMSCGKKFCAVVRCPDCKKLTCTCKMEGHKINCTQSIDVDTGFVEATCTCPECGVDFYRKEDLTIHISIHEVLASNAQKMRETCTPEPSGYVREDFQSVDSEPSASSEDSTCRVCNQTFPDPTMGPYHEMMHKTYPVHCSKCNIFFSTLLDLRQQRCLGKKHHKAFKYRCIKCNCITMDLRKMKRHRARCEGRRETCGKCMQKFLSFSELAKHVEVCPSGGKDTEVETVEEHRGKVFLKVIYGPASKLGAAKNRHFKQSASSKPRHKGIKQMKVSSVLEKCKDLPDNSVATSEGNCQICGRVSPELIQSHAKSSELPQWCSDCVSKMLQHSVLSKSRKRAFSPCRVVSEKPNISVPTLSQTGFSSVISSMDGYTWVPLTKRARKALFEKCQGCGRKFEDFPSLCKHVSECMAVDKKEQSLQEFPDSEKTPPTPAPHQWLNITPPSQQIHCTQAVTSTPASIEHIAMGCRSKGTSQGTAVGCVKSSASVSFPSARIPTGQEAAVHSSDSGLLGCKLEMPQQVPAKSFERNIVCEKAFITNTSSETSTGGQSSNTQHTLERVDDSLYSIANMNASSSSSSSGQQTPRCVVSHQGSINPVHKREDTEAHQQTCSLTSEHIAVTACGSKYEKKAERGTDYDIKQPSFQTTLRGETLIQSCNDSQIKKCSVAGDLSSLESENVMPAESTQESAINVPTPVGHTTHHMSLVPQVSKCLSLANSISSERVGNRAVHTVPPSLINQDFEEVRKCSNNDSPNGVICNPVMKQQSLSHQDASERKPNIKFCQNAPPEPAFPTVLKDCSKRPVPKRLHTLRNEMKVASGKSKNAGVCREELKREPGVVPAEGSLHSQRSCTQKSAPLDSVPTALLARKTAEGTLLRSDSVSTSVKVEPDVERGNSADRDIASDGIDVTHFCVYCLEEFHSREELWMHAAVCRDAHLVSISDQVTGGLKQELSGPAVARLHDPIPFTVLTKTSASQWRATCSDMGVNLNCVSADKNAQMGQPLFMHMKSRKKKQKKEKKKKKKKKKTKRHLRFAFSRAHRDKHRDVKRAVRLKCELCSRKFESQKQFEKHKRGHVTKRVKKKLKLELKKLSPWECAKYSRDCGLPEQSAVVKSPKSMHMCAVQDKSSSTSSTHSLSEAGATMPLGQSCVMQAMPNDSVLNTTEPAPLSTDRGSSSSKHKDNDSQSISVQDENGEPKKKKSTSTVGVIFPPVIEVFCQVCGQKFGHPSTLERHTKLHQG